MKLGKRLLKQGGNINMNEKLIKVGKTTLATIMATTMSLGVVSSFPVFAEEVETAQGESVVASFAPNEDPNKSVEAYRTDVQNLIQEAEGLYEVDKYRPATERQVLEAIQEAKDTLADPTLGQDAAKLSWKCYNLKNSIQAMQMNQNINSESAKQIILMNKEFAAMNETEYDLTKWNAFKADIADVISRINGNAGNDYTEDVNRLTPMFVELKNSKIDQNLAALKAEVLSAQNIIVNQQNSNHSKNYTRESWDAFTKAYQAAKAEVDKAQTSIDPSLANTLITNLQVAKANLKEVTENDKGVESGILSTWTEGFDGESTTYERSYKVRGGHLYVSNEVVNDDGTSTVTVTWENSGVDPVTGGLFHNVGAAKDYYGKEYSLRPFEKSDLSNRLYLDTTVKLDGEYVDDTENQFGIENLSEDQVLNGFTHTFTVPAGSAITLELGQEGTTLQTSSLGTYYTKNGPDMAEIQSAPTIKVPSEDIVIGLGNKFDPMKGVSATDKDGKDITDQIKVESNVDTSKVGEYSIKYTVTDKDGLKSSKTVKVKVMDKVSINTNKEETPKKDKGTNTGVFTATGLFTGILGASAAGMGVLEFLKKRKNK